MIRQVSPARIRSLGNNECEIIMMTSALARDGHVIDPAGMMLTNYQRNPVVLWQHQPECPVGIASNITRYSDRIAARITFAPAGVSSTADEVRGLVKSGIVSAVSIGFDVLDAAPLDPKRPRGGLHITKSELLECSFVSVPADVGAVVTARSLARAISDAGNLLRAPHEHLAAAIEHHRQLGQCIDRGDLESARRPHVALGGSIRGAARGLDGAEEGLPNARTRRLVREAQEHVEDVTAHHRRVSSAIDRGRRTDAAGAAMLLGRSLRAAAQCMRDASGDYEAQVSDGFSDTGNEPRSARRRQAEKLRLRGVAIGAEDVDRDYRRRQAQLMRLRDAPLGPRPSAPILGGPYGVAAFNQAEEQRRLAHIRQIRPAPPMPARTQHERRAEVEALRR